MSSSSSSSWRRGINSLCISSNDFSPGRKCLFNLFEQEHQPACLWMFNSACVSKDVKRYFSIHYMCTTTLLWSFPTRWGVYGHAPSNNHMEEKKKKKKTPVQIKTTVRRRKSKKKKRKEKPVTVGKKKSASFSLSIQLKSFTSSIARSMRRNDSAGIISAQSQLSQPHSEPPSRLIMYIRELNQLF